MSSSVSGLLKEYYENALQTKGVNYAGLAWPDAESTIQRYQVMTELFTRQQHGSTPISILDVGCGPGFYLDYLLQSQADLEFDYQGIDISPRMIDAAKARHPNAQFEVRDILQDVNLSPTYDYVIANGILTVKSKASYEEMATYSRSFLKSAFELSKKGLAVNFMSEQVDWQRDDLFHFPFDEAAAFVTKELTRHYVFRADYGLYEYTAYLFHTPADGLDGANADAMIDVLKGAEL